jgi:formate/nitrite transporter FocA (FNT family)
LERNKRIVPAIIAPFIIGMIGLLTLMRQPRFESFHTVDVLQLLASGACFGAALAALIYLLRSGGRS